MSYVDAPIYSMAAIGVLLLAYVIVKRAARKPSEFESLFTNASVCLLGRLGVRQVA